MIALPSYNSGQNVVPRISSWNVDLSFRNSQQGISNHLLNSTLLYGCTSSISSLKNRLPDAFRGQRLFCGYELQRDSQHFCITAVVTSAQD